MGKRKSNINYNVLPKTIKELSGFTRSNLQLDDKQANFVDSILNPEKLIVFVNAKAGTGKTTLAVGAAQMLYDCEYDKYFKGIYYIASPTQEQKQGFLPGDISSKSEPYYEPFYEALTTIGVDYKLATNQNIEDDKFGSSYLHPMTHTYMRGANLANAVVIVDECQNYYLDELKKVLTRCHDSCKIIVIGHSKQCDLYNNPERSGFVRYIEHFKDEPYTAVCQLTKNYRGLISSKADSLEF